MPFATLSRRVREIIRFVGKHSDSLRAAYGGCSLDAHCGGCVRPTGYMVQNHVSQQTSAPVSSLDKTGASVYNTDIRTAFTCRVRSFPVASLELEENAAAFLGGGYFLRFKIPKTTVASSIRSVSTSIVVMRVTPLFRGDNLAVPYQQLHTVNKPLFGAAFVYFPRISIT